LTKLQHAEGGPAGLGLSVGPEDRCFRNTLAEWRRDLANRKKLGNRRKKDEKKRKKGRMTREWGLEGSPLPG